jgi:hypothetical protein
MLASSLTATPPRAAPPRELYNHDLGVRQGSGKTSHFPVSIRAPTSFGNSTNSFLFFFWSRPEHERVFSICDDHSPAHPIPAHLLLFEHFSQGTKATVAMPGVVDEDTPSPGRLLLVSNRIPITIKRSDDGTYTFSMSSGGLVTGLSGLSKATTFEWYGWPGLEVPEQEAGPMIQRLKDEYNAHPVFVDDELADRHYNGFASMFLPPLLYDSFPVRVAIVRLVLIDVWQTPSFGPCSIITLARSPSTSLRGARTEKSTGCSPRPLSRMCRTAT